MKRIQRFVTLLAVLSMAVFCIPAFVNAASFEMLKYDFEDDVKPICGAAFALNDTVSYSGAKALKFDPNAADNWGLQIEPALTVLGSAGRRRQQGIFRWHQRLGMVYHDLYGAGHRQP